MVERRTLVGAGLAAGFTALAAPGAATATTGDSQDDAAVASEVRQLQSIVQGLPGQFWSTSEQPWRGVEAVRRQQREWLKSAQKYPDFMEVGIGIWESLHDWHVRYQQPIAMTRLADGRYAMSFMFTTLLLRHDLDANYVGYPSDQDRRP